MAQVTGRDYMIEKMVQARGWQKRLVTGLKALAELLGCDEAVKAAFAEDIGWSASLCNGLALMGVALKPPKGWVPSGKTSDDWKPGQLTDAQIASIRAGKLPGAAAEPAPAEVEGGEMDTLEEGEPSAEVVATRRGRKSK